MLETIDKAAEWLAENAPCALICAIFLLLNGVIVVRTIKALRGISGGDNRS